MNKRASFLNDIDQAFQVSNMELSMLADNTVSSLFSVPTGPLLTNNRRFHETGVPSAINSTYSSVATNQHQSGKASENSDEQFSLQNSVQVRSTYAESDNAFDGREFHVASGTKILSTSKESGVPANPARPVNNPDQVQPILDFDSPWSRVIRFAISDLASRENVGVDQIELDVFERGIWSDSSLGCSMPGYAYGQALVDGYRIRLELNDERFDYHGAYNKREFYNPDHEYVDLPDIYFDPEFCQNPTSSLLPGDLLSGGSAGVVSPVNEVELRMPTNQAIAGNTRLSHELPGPASTVLRDLSTSLVSGG